MRLNLLVATSQLNSRISNVLGTGSSEGLSYLADLMSDCGIVGDIYDLPNGAQNPGTASPFSLTNGFALKTDELAFNNIPELREDKSLLADITKIADTHQRLFGQKRTVNYALKRSVMPWVLEACYQIFKHRQYQHRQEQYQQFQEIASYWLEDYALFEYFLENGVDLSDRNLKDKKSPQTMALKRKAGDRLECFKYQQFLCFEQKQAVRQQISRQNIRLFVNLPFGVELQSADVFFHPEVFDVSLQVGCSPEPEHGYPEQAWGIAVYRETSPGLRTYLEEKMKWLSMLGDGIFLDHMVGWCGQYVLPMTIPADSVYPHGWFLTTDPEERKRNMHWFLEIILQTGLEIRGEIAGDHQRVLATIEAVDEVRAAGHEIGAMAIPRWETVKDRLKPLCDYQPATLTMVETHDTSTLLQYLLNRKGYNADFESPAQILEFCRRVLGLPFFEGDVPLTLEGCDDSFWFEICRRFTDGTPSRELLFTLPGLLSLLCSEHRSATIENNINVKPGTSGAVGNGWGNWSYFSPPLEIMQEDDNLHQWLTVLGKRTFAPFDYFHDLAPHRIRTEDLVGQYSRIGNRKIIYRGRDQLWRVWEQPAAGFELELVLRNRGKEELWERVDLAGLLDLNQPAVYRFMDLNDEMTTYDYDTGDLRENHLFVRLSVEQIHHFLISRE